MGIVQATVPVLVRALPLLLHGLHVVALPVVLAVQVVSGVRVAVLIARQQHHTDLGRAFDPQRDPEVGTVGDSNRVLAASGGARV